jgi:hypothetical protein
MSDKLVPLSNEDIDTLKSALSIAKHKAMIGYDMANLMYDKDLMSYYSHLENRFEELMNKLPY